MTEDDVRAMYDRFVHDEKKRREYHPAWIVLQIAPGSSPQAAEERRLLAQQLASRAARGEDFAALAKQYSDEPKTRDQGGDLGIRAPQGSREAVAGRKEILGPELENAVMQLEPNQVTAPIELEKDGVKNIFILKLLSRQQARYPTYEASKNDMLQLVQAELLGRAKKKWLEELKARTHLEVRL